MELYLAKDNLTVFEKTHTNQAGETVTILFARSREIPESALPQEFADTGIPADKVQRTFNTENSSPFRHFIASHKQAGVFIDRFFHEFSYGDLAVKYDVTEHTARTMYHNAVQRIREVLHEMDRADKRKSYVTRMEERTRELPKGQRWYLLNRLFGLLPSEIAEMEGLKGSSTVRQLIIRVSDQLRAGEIRLIDSTPDEAQAAKARLDAHNAKRRALYARNKAERGDAYD